MHYLHQVFNKFKAILNIPTIYKQASSRGVQDPDFRTRIGFEQIGSGLRFYSSFRIRIFKFHFGNLTPTRS